MSVRSGYQAGFVITSVVIAGILGLACGCGLVLHLLGLA
jgi:hypothetical protein